MSRDRLFELEENLELLHEQKLALEREILLTTGLLKTQAEQRLRLDIKPQIRQYEQEYWQLLAARSTEAEIATLAEPKAEVVVAELVQEVSSLTTQPDRYSAEMLHLLQQIQDKLNAPDATAAAKLKGAISLMPPFVNLTYEGEIDTESFFRTHFPTFRRWAKELAKK
jgi:hypothetical protein